MNGQFSRCSFDPRNHYSGVLLQEGRVLVDAEWNEQSACLNEQVRRTAADLLKNARYQHLSPLIDDLSQPLPDTQGMLSVRLQNQSAFYVDGARCQIEGAPTLARIHPADAQVIKNGGPYVVSVHAWEHIVSSIERPTLAEPLLENADSAARTKLVWEFQIDADDGAGDNYDEWIQQQRGRIRIERSTGAKRTQLPSLYRVQVLADGWLGNPPNEHQGIRVAWAFNNPQVEYFDEDLFQPRESDRRLPWMEVLGHEELGADTAGRFYRTEEFSNDESRRKRLTGKLLRFWNGLLEVEADHKVRLDERISITFESNRKYRAGTCWLIPFRPGDSVVSESQNSSEVASQWMLPTGQHYFARADQVRNHSTISDTSSIGESTSSAQRHPQHRLANRYLMSDKQFRRQISADKLADETSHLWLRKWLGTALLSEVITDDLDQFINRLTRHAFYDSSNDDKLRAEAEKVWHVAKELDSELNHYRNQIPSSIVA